MSTLHALKLGLRVPLAALATAGFEAVAESATSTVGNDTFDRKYAPRRKGFTTLTAADEIGICGSAWFFDPLSGVLVVLFYPSFLPGGSESTAPCQRASSVVV